MPGRTDEAAGGSLEQRAAAFLDLQIASLLDEGAQKGGLAAGRVGAALRTLFTARDAIARSGAEPNDPSTPVQNEGDEDDDDFEPPRDDAEGRALDAIILRGLDRIAAESRPAATPLAFGAAGQTGPGAAFGDRASQEPDTS